ncbi:MAG: UDP-glucose 4-epimerase GalE [Actinomycetaceae bacterium]|nr:UDP-glucose 4-epimerase GalE [Actinomycetaceae bacterium]
MAWMIAGGAGYIGSHVVRAFQEVGIEPIVYDNLSTGRESFLPEGVTFVKGDIKDSALVEKTLREHKCEGVVCLAGYKYAGESVKYPLLTYDQNVTGIVAMLEAMQRAGVNNYVFSSSAAVYGTPDVDLVTEDSPTNPESPYGETKLIGEWLAANVAKTNPDWRYVNLRYFNVVGSGSDQVYDASPYSLFSITFNRLLDNKVPTIFGDDYPTEDGTCIRDYIHVSDLAHSHVAAAVAMNEGRDLETVYNLGSGNGSSVAEIMDEISTGTGIDFKAEITPRRPGDPARIVANGDKAARDLEWKMRHTLNDMVVSAWRARQANAE